MESPLLIHRLIGKANLPIRSVTEAECYRILRSNIEKLRHPGGEMVVPSSDGDKEAPSLPGAFHIH